MNFTHSGPSRRRYPRVDYTASAIVLAADRTCYSRVQQLSEGGLMLNCLSHFDVGTPISLHFVLGDLYIRVKCEVIYQLSDDLGQRRMGVKFTSIMPSDRDSIRAVVADHN